VDPLAVETSSDHTLLSFCFFLFSAFPPKHPAQGSFSWRCAPLQLSSSIRPFFWGGVGVFELLLCTPPHYQTCLCFHPLSLDSAPRHRRRHSPLYGRDYEFIPLGSVVRFSLWSFAGPSVPAFAWIQVLLSPEFESSAVSSVPFSRLHSNPLRTSSFLRNPRLLC